MSFSCEMAFGHSEHELDWVVPWRVLRKRDAHQLSSIEEVGDQSVAVDRGVVHDEHKLLLVFRPLHLAVIIPSEVLISQLIFQLVQELQEGHGIVDAYPHLAVVDSVLRQCADSS